MSIYELLDSFEIGHRVTDYSEYWENGTTDYAIVSGPGNSEMWLSLEGEQVYMTVYARDDIGCLFVAGDDSCSYNELRDTLLEWNAALGG